MPAISISCEKDSSQNSVDFVLPKVPQNLCFNAEEFTKSSFSVDHFLQDHRKKANLENMRDDLGIYLKTLRSAMIELINRDYSEFISLSANLIDLDKKLDNIHYPISELAKYITRTHGKLENLTGEMSMLIRRKKQLKLQKQTMANLQHIQQSMIILNQLSNLDEEELLLQRILSEIIYVHFHITCCQDRPEFENIKDEWEVLRQKLVHKLRDFLLRAYNEKQGVKVSCYYTALVDLIGTTDVEKFIFEEINGPVLDSIISEESLQSDPRSLDGLFSRILAHVDNFNIVFGVGSKTNEFLHHRIIPQILKRFSLKLKSMYAPGNPDVFHRRYNESFQFLEKLEARCSSIERVKQIRDCEDYKNFVNFWNFSVYFQLRFQNIATNFENKILEFSHTNIDSKKEPKLQITKETLSVIETCWGDNIFLPPILRRLWKFTLQIISRFCTFCDETTEDNYWIQRNVAINKISFIVYLHDDIMWLHAKLQSETIPLVARQLKLTDKKLKCLEETLQESLGVLHSKIAFTEQKIIDQVTKDSLNYIGSVNDIPRYFRRTNREMPTQVSSYIGYLTAPPMKFINDFPTSKPWLLTMFSIITKEYYNSVKEVMLSVQRTEESLRRFKKIREKSGGENNKSGVGDEDKIKQQILLDVQHYQSVVKTTGLNVEDVDFLPDLVQLVEGSMTKQED